MCDNLLNVFTLKLHFNDVRTNKQLELEHFVQQFRDYFAFRYVAARIGSESQIQSLRL